MGVRVRQSGRPQHVRGVHTGRTAKTLVSLLAIICEEGSTIISDALASYNELRYHFHYFVINKKVESFARDEELEEGEVLNVNVNHIENRWRWLREMYRDAHHTAAQYTQRLCDEHMYRFYRKDVMTLIQRTPLYSKVEYKCIPRPEGLIQGPPTHEVPSTCV